MSKIHVLKVEYDTQELRDILCTAVEGGIGYWSVVTDSTRTTDLDWIEVVLAPAEGDDFPPTLVEAAKLQPAIDKITNGEVELRSDIVDSIKSGDVGSIDSDGADCIVQIAMFGKVVYG